MREALDATQVPWYKIDVPSPAKVRGRQALLNGIHKYVDAGMGADDNEKRKLHLWIMYCVIVPVGCEDIARWRN